MTRARILVPVLVAGIALGMVGCSGTIAMSAAPDANNPACADVMVRLPSEVDGQARRWTDAQATGAWGAPKAHIVMACGLEEPGPSILPCQEVSAVDWLIDDSEAPRYRFTTYGRTPAVEVYLDSEVVSGQATLSALGRAVSMLPRTGAECTDRPE